MQRVFMSSSSSSLSKHCLLLFGCFNPVTVAHLRTVEEAADALKSRDSSASVRALLSPVSDGYKRFKSSLGDARHRVQMCKLAASMHNGSGSSVRLDVSEWETEQDDFVRTYEAAKRMVDAHGLANDRVWLVCGSDWLGGFETPGTWLDSDVEGLLRDFGLLMILRGEHTRDDAIQSIRAHHILSKMHERIVLVDPVVPLAISSTAVRNAIAAQRSISHLVPSTVLDYINEQKLYAS
jgi:nicotinamide mononucleotide adenylyltransferase